MKTESNKDFVQFNRPYLIGVEGNAIQEAIEKHKIQSDGYYTKECQKLINQTMKIDFSLVTNSCTASLEMSALLADITVDDEVIMPSFTFSSTANAFVLRGAKPIFIDIRRDTLNIDENKIEKCITSKTKAIVPVHYAGVACAMDKINALAAEHSLLVIEDAAQGMMSTFQGESLGTIGDIGCISFHATKNIVAGEGGAITVKDKSKQLLAEMIREKGTDRSQFVRGEIDKYTWKTVGSSYLPSEITSAFLLTQLMKADEITIQRKKIWNFFYKETKIFEERGLLRRPFIPAECGHNAHIFYLVLNEHLERDLVLEEMKKMGVQCTSHYSPLHLSPAGLKYGEARAQLQQTVLVANKIIRLPLWIGMTEKDKTNVISALSDALNTAQKLTGSI